jgi:hypothetical protein
MKTKAVLLWALVLFVADQIVKVVIDSFFINVKFEIIPPLFYFKPTFNHQYSWINGLFGLGMGFWAHVIIYIFLSTIFVLIYDLMKTISANNKMVNLAFMFGFAGVMSSFFGTVVWNGCLDYIYLKPFTVFDMKDLYANTFMILILLYYLKNYRYLSKFKIKDINAHYKNRYVSILGSKRK